MMLNLCLKEASFLIKDPNSYLYLAKIYNHKEDQKKEENLDATIEPDNEEAILMLMKIGLEKSNYSKVKDLSKHS